MNSISVCHRAMWRAWVACILQVAARVELHVHLDGSLDAHELLSIAQLRGISKLPDGQELSLATWRPSQLTALLLRTVWGATWSPNRPGHAST